MSCVTYEHATSASNHMVVIIICDFIGPELIFSFFSPTPILSSSLPIQLLLTISVSGAIPIYHRKKAFLEPTFKQI